MRILNLEPGGYSDKAYAILKKLGQIDNGPLTRAQLLKKIGNYDILIVRLGHKIDAQIIKAAKKLKYIVTATTGLNHIDQKAAAKKKIKILSLKGETKFLDEIHATAEHTWALLLALYRHIPDAAYNVLLGHWNRDLFKGNELANKTILIVGYGRIGRKIEKFARAFSMNVLLHDKEGKSLAAQLKEADIVSVHVAYDKSTHEIIDPLKMKKGAILINTARGETVNEKNLLKAVQSGHLAGAALDVLQSENKNTLKKDPLIRYALQHSNLIITPHLGGATHESMEKTEIFMAKKLQKALRR
jgi:D-3-phosphoglycerate dehydrogenase / 2-oxoglutarate reductase